MRTAHDTKDEALHVVKRWFGDIADLRAKHKLVVLTRDNAGEYKFEEIMQYLNSKGIKSHFSCEIQIQHTKKTMAEWSGRIIGCENRNG